MCPRIEMELSCYFSVVSVEKSYYNIKEILDLYIFIVCSI